MRINNVENVFQVYNRNTGTKKVKSEKSLKDSDEIKISEKAIEFQFALQKVKDVEEIRSSKVDTIKNQIQAGTYHVDGKKIAEKMLDSINFNKKI